MYLVDENLTNLCDQRRFDKVIEAYEGGNIDMDDAESLYQVYLAYTMLQEAEKASSVAILLPDRMRHDVNRDRLLAVLRSPSSTEASLGKALHDSLTLLNEAIVKHNYDRIAVAAMTKARLHSALGEKNEASACMSYALAAIERDSSHPKWRENISLWYLALRGYGGGKRTQALMWAMRDPVPARKLAALVSYLIPVIGRRLMT